MKRTDTPSHTETGTANTVTRLWAGLLGFHSQQRQGLSLRHSVQTGSGTHPIHTRE